MTLHPAEAPGSDPAIDIPAGDRRFTGHWVADGLMLSNLPFERDHVWALAREGVDLVLNMCEDSEYRDGQRHAVEVAYTEVGIEEDRTCCLHDLGEHSSELLEVATRLIIEANADGRNVAVHCLGGRERSSTVAAAVRIRRDGLSVDAALERLRAIAPQAQPLSHQRAALKKWSARVNVETDFDAAFGRAVATCASALAEIATTANRTLNETKDLEPQFREALRRELGEHVLPGQRKFDIEFFKGNPKHGVGGVDVVVDEPHLSPSPRALAELKWCQTKDLETFAWAVFDVFKMAMAARSPGAHACFVVVGAPTDIWKAQSVCGGLLTDGSHDSAALIETYDGQDDLFSPGVAWPTSVPRTIDTVVVADAPVPTPHGLWKLRAIRVEPGEGEWIACANGRPLPVTALG